MTTSSKTNKGFNGMKKKTKKIVKQKKQVVEIHIYIHQVPSGGGGNQTVTYDPARPNYTVYNGELK